MNYAYICLRIRFLILIKLITMNKGDLIDKIAADAGITKASAVDALNSFMNAVKSTLQKGNKVTLVGFGSFSVSKRTIKSPASTESTFLCVKKLFWLEDISENTKRSIRQPLEEGFLAKENNITIFLKTVFH